MHALHFLQLPAHLALKWVTQCHVTSGIRAILHEIANVHTNMNLHMHMSPGKEAPPAIKAHPRAAEQLSPLQLRS